MSFNVEHIDLIPHPMDAWRAALDALIACAPGDACDIAWHLADSQVQVQLLLDRTPATPGVVTLVDRLMLIAAGRLIGTSPAELVEPVSASEAAKVIQGFLHPELHVALAPETAPPVCTHSRRPGPGLEDHQPELSHGRQRHPHQSSLRGGEKS